MMQFDELIFQIGPNHQLHYIYIFYFGEIYNLDIPGIIKLPILGESNHAKRMVVLRDFLNVVPCLSWEE